MENQKQEKEVIDYFAESKRTFIEGLEIGEDMNTIVTKVKRKYGVNASITRGNGKIKLFLSRGEENIKYFL